jgi:predicted nucleic acid-binding protein
LKLIVDEPESEPLQDELGRWPARTSSALLGLEAIRACRRLGDEVADSAEAALAGIALVPIDDAVLSVAGRLDPRELPSLDAIHLATALSIGDELGALFCYDDRLTAAAVAAGLRVLAPA